MKIIFFKLKIRLFRVLFWLPFLVFLVSGCIFDQSAVERSEFDELSGRVDNLEDIVITRKVNSPGQPDDPLVLPGPVVSAPTTALQSPGNQVSRGSDSSRYYQAQSLLKQKKYEQAASIFRAMLSDNPNSNLAPNARYWLGECFYALGDFQGALTEFRQGLNDYPTSNKAPDCLLKIYYCQSRLGDGPGAMENLRLLLSRYPESDSAQMVKSGRSRFNGIE
jgi:tol-pal system protein YbgF